MAFVNLVPVAMNASPRQGLAQEFQSSPVQTPAGVAVDLSAWNSIIAEVAPPAPLPYGATAAIGTCTGSAAGVLSLVLNSASTSGLATGSGNLIIKGKLLVGDDYQLLSAGVLNIQNGP